MKIGIIGLPQTGKKTLFELLTGHRISEKDLASNKPLVSLAEIKDPRFEDLVARYKPKKEVRARIDFALLPKLEKEAIAKGDIFKDIADADAVCHIVRAFRDDSVYHVEGSVDPYRDIDTVNAELVLNDLVFIEKRLERIDKSAKGSSAEAEKKEKELLLKLKEYLEKETPLRLAPLNADEKKLIVSYPFITRKAMLMVLNISEADLADSSLAGKFRERYQNLKADVMAVSAKSEREIASFESEGERREFMEALGIKEPAINRLTRLSLKALDLISFFTVGQDEVRQWTLRAGSTAPQAAGAIHSDLEKGFIRAEVIKYADLAALGSEEKVKEAGKFYLKGKDYTVEDGDILNIRFNV